MPIKVVPAEKGRRNTQRENRLEELGRVDAEKAYTPEGKRNLRDEKYRIRHELKRGGRASESRPRPGPSARPPKKIGREMGQHKRDSRDSMDPREAEAYKKGGKVKNGLSPQSHYVQYGYGPHKRDKKAAGGVIKGAIKAAKTVAAPGTHIRNVVSGKRFKDVTTKLIKGLPKIAKRGWK